MRLTEYTCDLCGDTLREPRKLEDKRPFVSFEFGPGYKSSRPGDRFVVRDFFSVERHICCPCLAGMAAMAEREMPKWRESR